MAQTYGDRWQIIRDIAHGGQADVFEVRDLRANDGAPTLALKRVKNPNRHRRFRHEVEAIESLDHPNVIKLIDHSALDVTDEAPEMQYLVMPLARGGDLSKRVSLYRNNLDGTLIVAQQIAAALETAHRNGIVHRDVKPANILFPEDGTNDVWLTDFGICFLWDRERATERNEVVGPWAFIAPELEYGGVLTVKPTADVYSLGKLLYYMVSGGVVLAREQISDSKYAGLFAPGGRYHLLEALLRKMICTDDNRLSMSKVIDELKRIASWDKQSELVAITAETRSKLATLQNDVLRDRQVAAQNQENRDTQREFESDVRAHLMAWLKVELDKIAAQAGAIESAVQPIEDEDLPITGTIYRPVSGIELALSNVSTRINRSYGLQILYCHSLAGTVEVRVVIGNQPDREVPKPPEDREIGIVPMLAVWTPGAAGPQRGGIVAYLFGPTGDLVAVRSANRGLRPVGGRRLSAPPSDSMDLICKFRYSAWPSVENELRAFIAKSFEYFIGAVTRNKDSTFIQ